MAGVVVHPLRTNSLNVAFPGRMAPGRWCLELQPKGFGLSHGSRHIYNMNGGKVFEIDFLFARRLEDDKESAAHGGQALQLPSLQQDRQVSLYIPTMENEMLAMVMDC